jgi:hypothetical protein
MADGKETLVQCLDALPRVLAQLVVTYLHEMESGAYDRPVSRSVSNFNRQAKLKLLEYHITQGMESFWVLRRHWFPMIPTEMTRVMVFVIKLPKPLAVVDFLLRASDNGDMTGWHLKFVNPSQILRTAATLADPNVSLALCLRFWERLVIPHFRSSGHVFSMIIRTRHPLCVLNGAPELNAVFRKPHLHSNQKHQQTNLDCAILFHPFPI